MNILPRIARIGGLDWPSFSLADSLRKSKSSKKVFSVDRIRNAATLDAVRLAARSQGGGFSAGFSIINSIDSMVLSIPNYIKPDTHQLKGTKRQKQLYSTPPQWRNAKPELQACFYQLAMLKQAEQLNQILMPFTLDLTPEFVQRATLSKKGFIDYTKRQLDLAFKSGSPIKRQYWFTVEMADLGTFTSGQQRPHLHGSIIVSQSEIESVRKQKTPISKIFHAAIGDCSPDFSNRLLDIGNYKEYAEQKNISELEACIGWAGYSFKHNAVAKMMLGSKSNLTADNATKTKAAELYSLLTK